MRKNPAIVLTILAVALSAASCKHDRHARIVTALEAAATAWSTTNSFGATAKCQVMLLNGDPQLNVVGLVSTNHQDAFVAMMKANDVRPSRIWFWREKPHSFLELAVP